MDLLTVILLPWLSGWCYLPPAPLAPGAPTPRTATLLLGDEPKSLPPLNPQERPPRHRQESTVQLAAGGGREPDPDSINAHVDRILTNLQKRNDDLKDIRCDIRYVEDDQINLTKRTKRGSILLLMADPNPLIFFDFKKTDVDGELRPREWYLFDGRWWYEASARLKQVTQREMAREGEKLDMFDIESSPIPLPFGQKKKTILRNFHVTLADPSPADPPGTDHLVLIPKATSKLARRYDKLDFYILKDVHLPRRIVVTKNDGLEINTADFPDLSEKSINAGVTKKDFAHPRAWKKYEVVIEKLSPERPTSP